MNPKINVRVEKVNKGFSIKVEDLNFFVSTSMINLIKISRMNKFDKKVNDLNIEVLKYIDGSGQVLKEYLKEYIENRKKLVALSCDHIIGKGAFNKLYAKYNDLILIDKIAENVITEIEKQIKAGI